MLVEPGNQFSLTRAALSTCGRAKTKFLSLSLGFGLRGGVFGPGQHDLVHRQGGPAVIEVLGTDGLQDGVGDGRRQQLLRQPQRVVNASVGLPLNGARLKFLPVDFTRAALSTCGRAKTKFLSLTQ